MKNTCNLDRIDYKETNYVNEIEKSIITKYRPKLWTKFIKGVKEYSLTSNNDTIGVCISGGKDSLLMAKLFQEYKRHVDPSINLEFIAMDPGFNSANRELLEDTCKKLNIPVKIFKTDVFKIVDKIAQNYPCYMCARMRRGALYSYAKELGCNKIALGHHYDDFVETILLNVLYGGKYQAMMPKLKSKNYEGMELIRPLVFIEEKHIVSYNNYNKINNMNCGCVVAAKKTSSKRAEVKNLIEQLYKVNKDVKHSIFSSSQNVNIDAILGWKEKNRKKKFLDD